MKLLDRIKSAKAVVTPADPAKAFEEVTLAKQLRLPEGTFEYTLEVNAGETPVVRCAYYLQGGSASKPPKPPAPFTITVPDDGVFTIT